MNIVKRPLILSLLSALLLSLGWLGVSGLPMLFAFVPLLLISDRCDGSRRGWWKTAGWVALSLGLWSAATTWWIGYATIIGPILSVLITVGLFGGVFMLYHSASKRMPKVIAYAILVCGWIAAEYLYTVGDLSFPWLVLGNGLANDAPIVQWYSATGVFGGSLWILLCNVMIHFDLLKRKKGLRVAAAAVIAVPVVISFIQYFTFDGSGRPVKVSVVQPNIDPYNVKFNASQQYQDSIIFSLALLSPPDVDIIITPETAIAEVHENDFRQKRELAPYRNFLRENFPGAHMILGATTVRYYNPGERVSETARMNPSGVYWYDVYNSAIMIDTASRFDVHHKSMFTPGVEKVPFYSVTKHIEWLIVDMGGPSGQLGYDTVRTVFTLRDGTKLAAGICYESVYGAYFTEFVRGGAELMAIITNDGWWSNSPGYRQHFSFARLRAIETRRDIARSANTGISGFIDARGDVVYRTGWWVPAQAAETLNARNDLTFYVRHGDYVARISCWLFGLAFVYYILIRLRKPQKIK